MCRPLSKAKGKRASAQTEAEPSRLPCKAIAALSLCNAAHFYSLCSIFSYAAFLCVDAGWVEHIDEAGYMAGLLPTAVMSGRILTSFAWGMVSDKIGPRAVLSLSMLAIAAGNLLFGFATPLWAALTVRFVVLGAANGWIAVIGPLSQELGGAERQSEVLGLVFASGPLVSMLGPALGGILYGTLGSRFPALAPSLVGVVFALIGFVAVRLWIPARKPPAPPAAELELELAAVTVIDARGSSTREAAGADGEPHASPGSSRPSEAGDDAPSRLAASRPSFCAVLCTHPLPLVMLVRAGAGGILFGMFDVVPLWLAASRGVGGLALDEKTLGGVLAATSVLMLPWSLGPMGRFIKRCGVRFAMRSGLLCAAFAFALAVPATLAADAVRPALGIAVIALVNSLATMASSTAGVASFAATNNASERFPARTGAINGVHITAEAIGKLLGPALGAPLMGALLGALRPSEGHVAALQLNGPSATFLIFGGASLVCFAGAVALPRSVDGPQRAALLHGRSSRSDAPAVEVEEAALEPRSSDPERV